MLPIPLLASLVLTSSTPVLVELFTSQGCSSCPSADGALLRLAREQPVAGVEVIALSFHVDYWNRLGWTDPYSRAEFSRRQQGYARSDGSVYTPQMVIDGTDAFVGSEAQARARLAGKRARSKRPLTFAVTARGARLEVSAPAVPGARLWLALAEDGLSSRVTSGENSGRTLEHAWVVRQRLELTGPTAQLQLDPSWKRDRLRLVLVAQEPGQGKVVALAWKPVP
jgi:hypothetical protein